MKDGKIVTPGDTPDKKVLGDVLRVIKKYGCKCCLFENKPMKMGKTMFRTLAALMYHVEKEHDVGFARKGETDEDALTRLSRTNSTMNVPGKCRCMKCKYGYSETQITQMLIANGKVILKNGTTYIAEIDQPMVELTLTNEDQKVEIKG